MSAATPAPRRRILPRLPLPRSLAGRTALLLIVGLVVVQVAGLTIHALDRVDLQRFQQARELSQRSFVIWRSLLVTAPDRRAAVLADLDLPSGLRATYDDAPAARHGHPPPPALVRMMRVEAVMSAPPRLRAASAPRGFRERRDRALERCRARLEPLEREGQRGGAGRARGK
jgi:hypothetical protein